MSEEMKKQESMDDYINEINASFSDFRDDDKIGRASCRERVSRVV